MKQKNQPHNLSVLIFLAALMMCIVTIDPLWLIAAAIYDISVGIDLFRRDRLNADEIKNK